MLLIALVAVALPAIAGADPIKLGYLDVTVDVPAGWSVFPDDHADVLTDGTTYVQVSSIQVPSCKVFFEQLVSQAGVRMATKPAWLGPLWYPQTAEVNDRVVTCAQLGAGVLAVSFTPGNAEVPAVLAALSRVVAPGSPVTPAPVAQPVEAPPVVVPVVDAPVPPIASPPPSNERSNESYSPRARQLRAGLRIGLGYDSVKPSGTTTMLAGSHYDIMHVEDSLPFAGGDLVGAATLGVGDRTAYDVEINLGPSVRLGEQLLVSALIGLGYDEVGGTMTQFQQPGGSYLQFVGRAVYSMSSFGLTGSFAILDDGEDRESADLVVHVPNQIVHSISIGVRHTAYGLATRTGAMLTVGF